MPDIYCSVLMGKKERQRPLTKRSDVKEDDDAESSKALAFTVEPSGASTRILQVISSELCPKLDAVFDGKSGALVSGSGNVEEGVLDACVLLM